MINNDKIFATEMNVYACSQGLFGPDEGVETVGDFQLGDCNNGHEDPDLDKAEESNENLIFTIDDECYKLKEFENGNLIKLPYMTEDYEINKYYYRDNDKIIVFNEALECIDEATKSDTMLKKLY